MASYDYAVSRIEHATKSNPTLYQSWQEILSQGDFGDVHEITEGFTELKSNWSSDNTDGPAYGFLGLKKGKWYHCAVWTMNGLEKDETTIESFVRIGLRLAKEKDTWDKLQSLEPVILAAIDLIISPTDLSYMLVCPENGDCLKDFYTLAIPPITLRPDTSVTWQLVSQQVMSVLELALQYDICPPRMCSTDIRVSVNRPLPTSNSQEVNVYIIPWMIQAVQSDHDVDYSPLRVILANAGFPGLSMDLVIHDRLWGLLVALASILLEDEWIHLLSSTVYKDAVDEYLETLLEKLPEDTQTSYARRLNPVRLHAMYDTILQPKNKLWNTTKNGVFRHTFPEVFSCLIAHLYSFGEPAAAQTVLQGCITCFR